MKSALSLALILCVVISALPVSAQESTGRVVPVDTHRLTADRPIVRAIAPEAARLAAEQLPVRQQLPPNFARTWSSVGTGALIGFGIGAALGMTVGQEACLHSPRWHCAKAGVPFAVIGAAVAWLHK